MKFYKDDRLDEVYYHGLSEMGLNIYFIPKKGFDRQYAIFSTNYGSVDNKFIPIGEEDVLEVPEGIAHFLEHKLFEEECGNIDEEFAKLGASVNAFTNFNQTSYLFSTTTNFYESLKILIEFVQNPHFTDENVEKEKGIIEQEIKMYEDDPGWRVFFNCLNALYNDHPVKIDIAGTVESIKDINKELLYKAYNTFYHPENMVMFIVGDLNAKEIKRIIDESERKDYKKLGEIKRIETKEELNINQKFVEDNMMTANPLFYIGIKDQELGLSGKEQMEKDLITNIILDMLFSSSSIFYNDLYDEGLIDTNFGAYYSGNKSYGHSIIAGESEDPRGVYDRIINLLNSPMEEILLEEDFERIRNDELGRFIMSFDSLEFIGNTGTDMFFDNFSLFKYLDLIEGLTYDMVKSRYKAHFIEKNMVLSTINPINKD